MHAMLTGYSDVNVKKATVINKREHNVYDDNVLQEREPLPNSPGRICVHITTDLYVCMHCRAGYELLQTGDDQYRIGAIASVSDRKIWILRCLHRIMW